MAEMVERVRPHAAALLDWYDRNGRVLPWRGVRDPYAVLVSEVMLQQTQVDRVIPKYREFLDLFPDLETLAAAPPADVIRAWSPLGYNRRAVRLHRIARAVAVDGLPRDVGALRRLEGVGEYTAAAVACFAFDAQVAVVDTNVRRVLTRLAGAARPSPAALRRAADALPPHGEAYAWNQAMMDLGATVCTAAGPKCEDCPLAAACAFAIAGTAGAVAEERAEYRVPPRKREAPFAGSRRYYRGRIVEGLRALPPGESAALSDLGAAIKDGFTERDEPWLAGLLTELERDGLAKLDDGRASLP